MENKNTTTLAEQKLVDSPKCKEDSLLPIAEKGLFFHDSFFEDIRKGFETAIDQILDTWGESKSVSDLMSSYRRVSERNLAARKPSSWPSSEDDQNHKVVLDVHTSRLETLGRVEDNEVVWRSSEKEEGDFKSMKSFCRRFNFPGKVDMEAGSTTSGTRGRLGTQSAFHVI
ncbi:uncharacterized protein LOC119574033 [Penaeus monodon]|uniref:uncharacterized protein LOC119574033 n=1 Tax=Penaeus monodon TaxID=6687 RepID=UPI0018A70B9B|nr:uncharacterized protein LOC119574033 [Penaeus monodon]